jgi:hypothetical protein
MYWGYRWWSWHRHGGFIRKPLLVLPPHECHVVFVFIVIIGCGRGGRSMKSQLILEQFTGTNSELAMKRITKVECISHKFQLSSNSFTQLPPQPANDIQ